MFRHADDHGPGGRAPGLSDQAVPGTLAGEGSPVCRPYGGTHHPAGNKDQGDRTGAGRHARKRAAELLGTGVGAVNHWVRTYREGGMAALRPRNRNAGQASKPAVRRDRDAGDAEAPRRKVEEPELENALMREVVEARRKRPGRRPMAPVEQGEDTSGRPSAPGVFARLDDMLARHRAERPLTATTPGVFRQVGVSCLVMYFFRV